MIASTGCHDQRDESGSGEEAGKRGPLPQPKDSHVGPHVKNPFPHPLGDQCKATIGNVQGIGEVYILDINSIDKKP